jgi:hypothetical protein
MPRNGSGVYSKPNGTTPVSGDTLEPAPYNELMDDFASEVTASLPRAGTAAMTGALAMGGYKVQNMADAAAMSDSSTMRQLMLGNGPWADAGGTADAITATYSPAIVSLGDGTRLRVRAASANATTTPTFSPNGLAARTITKLNGAALVAGDIAGDGHELLLVYDSTNTRWALLNPAPTAVTNLALTSLNINGATEVTDVDEAQDYVPIYDQTNTANRKVLARHIGTGLQTIHIPAAAMTPRTTNGAAPGSGETTTNKLMRRTFDFDAATQEHVQFSVRMPKGWNLGTVTAEFQWSHPSTTTNFGVVWAIRGVALSDAEAYDAAFGTEQTVTDTGGTTDMQYISAATAAMTIAGTPASGDVVVFEIYRVAANGSDTLAVDARLHGVTLLYTTAQNTDA